MTLPAFLVANAASLLGNSAIAVVLPWLVLERTGNPAVAGLVAALSAVPGAVAALVGGWLIDHLGRRLMSVVSDIGSAVSVAALAVVDLTVGLDVGWFIALGVLGALFDAPGMTARNTLLANVSQTSGVSLEKISGMVGAVFGLSFLVGPAAAGWLLAVLPSVQVVWVTAGCSALAALAIAVMPLDASDPVQPESSSPLAGFGYVRRSAPLLALLIVQGAAAVLVSPLLSVILPAHFTALGAPGRLGLSLSGYALGTMLGSAVFGWGFGQRHWRAWVVANACMVVSGLALAPLVGFWLVGAAMLMAGIGSGLVQPVTTVVLTTAVPDALRGRVFSVYSTLSLVVAPAGLGLMSVVIGALGMRAAGWVVGLGLAAVSAYALVVPGLRHWLDRPAGAEPSPACGGPGS